MGFDEIAGHQPEPTRYDRSRHEKMVLKGMKYGFHRIGQQRDSDVCSLCKDEIHGHCTKVNGVLYCDRCIASGCLQTK